MTTSRGCILLALGALVSGCSPSPTTRCDTDPFLQQEPGGVISCSTPISADETARAGDATSSERMGSPAPDEGAAWHRAARPPDRLARITRRSCLTGLPFPA